MGDLGVPQVIVLLILFLTTIIFVAAIPEIVSAVTTSRQLANLPVAVTGKLEDACSHSSDVSTSTILPNETVEVVSLWVYGMFALNILVIVTLLSAIALLLWFYFGKKSDGIQSNPEPELHI